MTGAGFERLALVLVDVFPVADGRKECGVCCDKSEKHPIISGDAKGKSNTASQFFYMEARITPVLTKNFFLAYVYICGAFWKFLKALSELLGVYDLHNAREKCPDSHS